MDNEKYLTQCERATQVIQEWIDRNKWELEARLGSDFAYYYEKGIIEWSPIVSDERIEKTFSNFVKKIEPNYCNNFIAKLLHEVGHYHTFWDINDNVYKVASFVERVINIIPMPTVLRHKIYFNLPHEIIATKWALGYIKRNRKEIEKLNNDLQDCFREV